MSLEIAVTQQQSNQMVFSQPELDLIKETICKGATDEEFRLFVNQARTIGLNPLARQVFAIKRWDSTLGREVMSIQVSIDGFRLIAERTGKYTGQTAPQWCGEDGIWRDVWLAKQPPSAARVGVLRSDFKEPCYGVARFDSYAQRKKDGALTAMWQKMGDVMIAKCAESLALRKAFPQELSGLYTSDEMEQTIIQDITPAQPVAPEQHVIEPPKNVDSVAQLVEDAKAFAQEIELCDTPEKLHALVVRNAVITGKLASQLPKWHAKLLALLDKQRASFVASEDATVGKELMAG